MIICVTILYALITEGNLGCMLSYYLLWHLNQALAPFYKKNPNYTRDYVIEIMKSLQKCKLAVANISSEAVAEPTENQIIIQSLVAGQTA